MKLIQLSDCHLFADKHKSGYNQLNPYLTLQQILQRVVDERPDLLLITGDLSGDSSAASYQNFLQLWQHTRISAPLRIIPGNHDDVLLLKKRLPEHSLEVSAPLQLGNWRIHGLNSKHQGTLGRLSAASLAQLQQQIQAQSKHFHLIAVHHHPLPVSGWMDKHCFENSQQLVELVGTYSQVKALIYGHVHMQAETKLGSCEYLACPSTCWQWHNSADFAVSPLAPGYRVIELAADGHITTCIQRLNQ